MKGTIQITPRLQKFGWRFLAIAGFAELIIAVVTILQGTVLGLILLVIAGFTLWEAFRWAKNEEKHKKEEWTVFSFLMGGLAMILLINLDLSWLIILGIGASLLFLSRIIWDQFPKQEIVAGYLLYFGIIGTAIAGGGIFKDLEWVIPLGIISVLMVGIGTWMFEGAFRGAIRFFWAISGLVSLKIAHLLNNLSVVIDPQTKIVTVGFMIMVAIIFAIAAWRVAGAPPVVKKTEEK
ncbi:hypothetical protein HYW55_06670 [Candidatus Gottesmanbacteria bacterium]|nr:hypothetical protein [Candidatus Gottesmanbacteria bacterium]